MHDRIKMALDQMAKIVNRLQRKTSISRDYLIIYFVKTPSHLVAFLNSLSTDDSLETFTNNQIGTPKHPELPSRSGPFYPASRHSSHCQLNFIRVFLRKINIKDRCVSFYTQSAIQSAMEEKESDHSGSSEYEVLVLDEPSPPPAIHQKAKQQQKDPSAKLNPDHELKMGVIVEEDTYVVLEAHENCCHSEECWQELILNKKKEAACKYQSEQQEQSMPVHTARLSFCQRNTILNIPYENVRIRMELWAISNFNQSIQQEYIRAQEYEKDNQEERRNQLQDELPHHEIEALKKGVIKITKILRNIFDQHLKEKDSGLSKEWIVHLALLKAHQADLLSWIERILQRCALEFKQIRYCKGLEYLCLGIIISYPEINFAKYSQLFHHFLKINQFWKFYLESSPKYYSELLKISLSLKEEHPLLNEEIKRKQGNLKNLFVSYFRSFLLYRISNPEIIRKIFELLFVEGVSVIKTMVLRALDHLTPNLLKNQHFLQTMASFVIAEYFTKCQNEGQQVTVGFKKLFQI